MNKKKRSRRHTTSASIGLVNHKTVITQGATTRSTHRLHGIVTSCLRDATKPPPPSAIRSRKRTNWRSLDTRPISFFVSNLSWSSSTFPSAPPRVMDHENGDEKGGTIKLERFCSAANRPPLTAVVQDGTGCARSDPDLYNKRRVSSARYSLRYVLTYSEEVRALSLSSTVAE